MLQVGREREQVPDQFHDNPRARTGLSLEITVKLVASSDLPQFVRQLGRVEDDYHFRHVLKRQWLSGAASEFERADVAKGIGGIRRASSAINESADPSHHRHGAEVIRKRTVHDVMAAAPTRYRPTDDRCPCRLSEGCKGAWLARWIRDSQPGPSHFVGDSDIGFRPPTRSIDDLPALMRLLADDPISAGRGDRSDRADLPAYEAALAELIVDSSNEILVVVSGADDPIATMQLTRIPGMARRGSTRLLVEAVRVASTHRSGGVGSAMMRWVIESAAQDIGSTPVQLTSDEARVDAHRFYERLGFVGSHRGFKFQVEQPPRIAAR